MSRIAPSVDLPPDHWAIVRGILRRHVPDRKVLAFGSRATWTAKDYSDLDLAIMGDEPLSLNATSALAEAFGESDLPFKVDLVDWMRIDEAFRDIIRRDGVAVQVQTGAKEIDPVRRSLPDSRTLGMATYCLGEMTIGALLARDGGNVKTGPFGTTLKAKEYSKEGVPLISVGEIGYGALRIKESTPRAPPEVVERLPEYVLQAGDIVFGRKGAVDRLAMVKPEQAGWFLGSDGIRLRLPSTCDARFIAYQLQGHEARSWLLQHATGTTMASLNQSTIERLPIVLPPLAEQRAIAHILGTLDDKIELNRRMNETLEALPRALFKSWFVNFDPVRAKMEGRETGLPQDIANMFPNRLVNSEMGEIPDRWDVRTLGNLCHKPQYGYTASAQREPVGPRFLRITDINKESWVSWSRVPYCKATNEEFSKYRLNKGDILIARMADPGHGILVEEDVEAVFASYLIRFRPGENHTARLLQYWLRSDAYWHLVRARATGTTRGSLNARVLSLFPLVVPPDAVTGAFAGVVGALRNRLVANVGEMELLASLRDTLLPKLISGEIRVGDAEKVVELVT